MVLPAPTTVASKLRCRIQAILAPGTNPEQLFAVGWSACFLSAIKLVAGKKRVALPPDVTVDADVDLGVAQGGYHLAARLKANLPGIDRETAQSLVETASQICPYSLTKTEHRREIQRELIRSFGSRQTQHA